VILGSLVISLFGLCFWGGVRGLFYFYVYFRGGFAKRATFTVLKMHFVGGDWLPRIIYHCMHVPKTSM